MERRYLFLAFAAASYCFVHLYLDNKAKEAAIVEQRQQLEATNGALLREKEKINSQISERKTGLQHLKQRLSSEKEELELLDQRIREEKALLQAEDDLSPLKAEVQKEEERVETLQAEWNRSDSATRAQKNQVRSQLAQENLAHQEALKEQNEQLQLAKQKLQELTQSLNQMNQAGKFWGYTYQGNRVRSYRSWRWVDPAQASALQEQIEAQKETVQSLQAETAALNEEYRRKRKSLASDGETDVVAAQDEVADLQSQSLKEKDILKSLQDRLKLEQGIHQDHASRLQKWQQAHVQTEQRIEALKVQIEKQQLEIDRLGGSR